MNCIVVRTGMECCFCTEHPEHAQYVEVLAHLRTHVADSTRALCRLCTGLICYLVRNQRIMFGWTHAKYLPVT